MLWPSLGRLLHSCFSIPHTLVSNLYPFQYTHPPTKTNRQPTYNKFTQPSITPIQQWKLNQMTETTGNTGNWPVPTPAQPPYPYTEGWWCTSRCYLPTVAPTGSVYGFEVRRNLKTYVEALISLNVPAIQDAIVVGFEIGMGTLNPGITAFTREKAGAYDWSWTFGE